MREPSFGDSISREWGEDQSKGGNTAKMTMIADINSTSEGGPNESELSRCTGDEIVSIANSQSFKFGPDHLKFVQGQPLEGCMNTRKIYNTV